VFTLYSCVRGNLLEVNERLITEPNLLLTKPHTEGFIAIIYPEKNEIDTAIQHLTTYEDYYKLRTIPIPKRRYNITRDYDLDE